jgi:DNA repair photolyase
MSVLYQPSGKAKEYSGWACNLYTGCTHGCVYCYAPLCMKRNRDQFHSGAQPRKNILKQLERDVKRMEVDGRVLLCFVTDPYQPCEERWGVTRQAIEILHSAGMAVQILTKGGLRATRDFDLLGSDDAYAATLTFVDPEKSMEWEPGAALPQERFDSLQMAYDRKIPTWVSLEPVIEPEETFRIIEKTHGYVDLYKIGPLNYHPKAREVDWGKFGYEVVDMLETYGNDYYLKKDLRKYMEPLVV